MSKTIHVEDHAHISVARFVELLITIVAQSFSDDSSIRTSNRANGLKATQLGHSRSYGPLGRSLYNFGKVE